MKIVCIDYSSPEYSGGVAQFTRNLIQALDCDIYTVSFFDGSFKWTSNSIHFGFPKIVFKIINRLTFYRLGAILVCLSLKWLKINSNDQLIINSPSFLRSKFIRNRYRFLLVHHQAWRVLYRNRAGYGGRRKFLGQVLERAEAIVVLSKHEHSYLRRGWKKYERKFKFIPHCSKLKRMASAGSYSTKNISMVCRLDNKQKRLDIAIDVISCLRDWKLNIYGKGRDRKFLEKMCKERQLKNVFFHGDVGNVEVAFPPGSIHLMTSDYEGFGLSNIEALSAGIPVIVRNTFPAAAEIVKKNKNGILLPKNAQKSDYVRELINVSKDYNYFSSGALESAAEYDISLFKTRWEKLLSAPYNEETKSNSE